MWRRASSATSSCGARARRTPPACPATPTDRRTTYASRRRALANGTVRDRDIVTDDLGHRYVVQSDYWDSLGYALRVERLEA
jgi:hypothetical protein